VDCEKANQDLQKTLPLTIVTEIAKQTLNWVDFGLSKVKDQVLYPLVLAFGDPPQKYKAIEDNTLTQEQFEKLPPQLQEFFQKVKVFHINGLNNLESEILDDDITIAYTDEKGQKQRLVLPRTVVLNYSFIENYAPRDAQGNITRADFQERNTKGLGRDLLQASLEFGGFGMADYTSQQLASQINQALTEGGYEYVTVTAHSHGGIKMAAAMSRVYPWLRDRVKIIDYGSANIKPFIGAGEIVTVHREKDFVSYGAGLNPIREFLIYPVMNLLGLTQAGTATLPAGENYPWYNEGLLLSTANTHSYDTGDQYAYGNFIGQYLLEIWPDLFAGLDIRNLTLQDAKAEASSVNEILKGERE